MCGASVATALATASACSARSLCDAARRGGLVAVGCRVGAPRGRAGEHAGRDRAVVDAHERLGARADEAVDREHPRVGVVVGEAGRARAQARPPRAARRRSRASTTFSNSPVVDPAHGLVDRRGVCLGRHGARRERTRGTSRFGAGSGISTTADARVRRTSSSIELDARDPGASVAAAEHDLGHDEHARGRGLVGERDRAERDEAGAGQPDAVVDVGGGREPTSMRRRRRATRSGPAVSMRSVSPRPIDALAAAHPEQRMPRVGARDRAARVSSTGTVRTTQPGIGGRRRRGIRSRHRTSLRSPRGDSTPAVTVRRRPRRRARRRRGRGSRRPRRRASGSTRRRSGCAAVDLDVEVARGALPVAHAAVVAVGEDFGSMASRGK